MMMEYWLTARWTWPPGSAAPSTGTPRRPPTTPTVTSPPQQDPGSTALYLPDFNPYDYAEDNPETNADPPAG
jgi:hypothetical protein